MREQRFQEEVKTTRVWVGETVSCDLCGVQAENEVESWDIFSLRLESGMDTCGHERVTRDICGNCYDSRIQPHWDAIFTAFKENETEELREYHEDI